MKRVGVIGCGKIGRPVVRALAAGAAGPWRLASVLGRGARLFEGIEITGDPDRFFAAAPDLILETGGPPVLRALGERALAAANVWSVSGIALADAAFCARLEAAGTASGHRLRLVAGAIAGLDALAALAVDPAARVTVAVDIAPTPAPRRLVRAGTSREIAAAMPDHVNVAVAAAIAGTGLDATRAEVWQPQEGEARTMRLSAESRYGRIETSMAPRVVPPDDIHTVAASLIAALRAEHRVIWSG